MPGCCHRPRFGRCQKPVGSILIIIAALGRPVPVGVIAVIALASLLELRRYGAVRIAPAVPDIEVGAVPTSDTSLTVRLSPIVTIIASRDLGFRREISIWIAHAIVRL